MFFLPTVLSIFFYAFRTVALVPPPASPGTDACGPFDHTGDAGFSTCVSSVVPGGPAAYGIVCGRDSSVTVPIRKDTCARSAKYMCYWLVQGDLAAGEWHWTGDNDLTDCRVGVYLSALPGAAPRPNYRRCLNQIFQPLVQSCMTTGRYNVGTVNIKALPDHTTNNTGQTVNPGYAAFIVSPMALYYSTVPSATPALFGGPNQALDPHGNANANAASVDAASNRTGPAAAAASNGDADGVSTGDINAQGAVTGGTATQ
ncbi:MAG: hypothetical protein Q9201_006735 [Fulgogasparrea decipioides]